jgi:hypothetical protein
MYPVSSSAINKIKLQLKLEGLLVVSKRKLQSLNIAWAVLFYKSASAKLLQKPRQIPGIDTSYILYALI